MSTIIINLPKKKVGPVPATGPHAELLAEMELTANALIKLIAREKSGFYDGFGQGFWTGSDSVLNMAQRLVKLAEQRTPELRDAAVR